MEPWQKQYIRDHLPILLESTWCNAMLLANLRSQQILSRSDVEAINAEQQGIDKAQLLYNILENRVNGYWALAKELATGRQTEAYNILCQGYAHSLSPTINVNFLGSTKPLSSYFDDKEIREIIEEAKQKISAECFLNFYENPNSESDAITLVGHNDESPSTLNYIPRMLFKRMVVNKELFQINCPDIFIFKDIQLHQLTELVKPHIVAYSGPQRSKITSRFIKLENDEDLEDILEVATVPTHLIKYEEQTSTCLLEGTTGVSTIINQYLESAQGKYDWSIYVTEDEFIEKNINDSVPGVCICDSPGMGKTLMLANLASKIATRYPDRLVAFISLPRFIRHLTQFEEPPTEVHSTYCRRALLGYLSTSPLALSILDRIIASVDIPLELLMDGFDEVPHQYTEFISTFLGELVNDFRNTRVYVTSRPHMRHQLEATLGVIAYDIMPFTEANQMQYLLSYWKTENIQSDENKISDFAKLCLGKLKSGITKAEKDITGIPLLCHLLAKIYCGSARIYCRPKRDALFEEVCQFESSLPELYKKYVEQSFDKMSNQTELIEEIKQYHIWMAFKTLFPEFEAPFSEKFSCESLLQSVVDLSVTLGILAKQFGKGGETVEFVHRTFAEYFVSEFVAGCLEFPRQLSYEFPVGYEKKVAKFLLETVLQTRKIGEAGKNAERIFLESVIVYFFNFFVSQKLLPLQNKILPQQFPTSVLPSQLQMIILGCARENYEDLFKFITGVFKLVDKFAQERLKKGMLDRWETHDVLSLLNISAKYSSFSFVDQLFSFFRDCLDYDLSTVCKKLPVHWETPLHFSIRRADIELVQFFANIISLEHRQVLRSCISRSSEDAPQIVRRKVEICKLLLKMNPQIITEDTYGLYYNLHLEFIKVLIEAGTDPQLTSTNCKTLVHHAAAILSSSDFHDLCVFLISERKLEDLFKANLWKWRNPVPYILHKQKNISIETLKLLLSIPGIDVNEKDGKSNTLFLIAVMEKHDTEILDFLVESGADIQATNAKSQSALHLAVLATNTSAIPILLDYNVDSKLRDGRRHNTFLHLMLWNGSTDVEEYHDILSLMSSKSLTDVFHMRNNLGQLPIHLAVWHAEVKEESLQLFKSHGVDFNSVDKHHHRSILMYAERGGRSVQFLKLLVEMGVDIMIRNKYGETFFHHISNSKKYSAEEYHELAEFLLSNGFEKAFLARYNDGSTPLHWTAYHREPLAETQELIFKRLVTEYSVDINIPDDTGLSILMCAAVGKRSIAFLRFLLDMGADVMAQNEDGLTFAHLLPEYYSAEDNYEIMKLLIQRGYGRVYQITDKHGNTPLHWTVCKLDCHQATWDLIKEKLVFTGLVNINSQNHTGSSILAYTVFPNPINGADERNSPVFQLKLKLDKNWNKVESDFQKYYYEIDVPTVCMQYAKRSNNYLPTLIELGANSCLQDNDGNIFAHFPEIYYSAEEYHKMMKFVIKQGLEKVFAVVNKKGETPVHIAVRVGHLKLLESTENLFRDHLFEPQIVDINSTDAYGDSILMFAAVGRRRVRFIKFLLEMGADVHLKNNDGDTFAHFLSHYYSAGGYHYMVEFLISEGLQSVFAETNNLGLTPLHTAFSSLNLFEKTLNLFRIHLFQAKIVDINSTDAEGVSILMYAAMGKRSIRLFRFLLDMGADLHLKDNRGDTFAHAIAQTNTSRQYNKIVHLIIKVGGLKIFHVRNVLGQTPLHLAVSHLYMGLLPRTLALLTNCDNCGLNAVEKSGRLVVLHHGGEAKTSLQFVKRLIRRGADWSVRCSHNTSLAHAAASFGLIEHLKYFVELGCNVNALDNDGKNVLQCAVADAFENIFEIVIFLLDKGADKHHKSKEGHTAYAYAVEREITEERILNALLL